MNAVIRGNVQLITETGKEVKIGLSITQKHEPGDKKLGVGNGGFTRENSDGA